MSLDDVLKTLPQFNSEEIIKAFVKGYSIINNPYYKNIVCSISGGSDSDIMLDIIHKIDVNNKVTYIWIDTGLEYTATKNHLKYLENKYDIKINKYRAKKTIPLCIKEYGQPFLSKYVSEQLGRLQRYGFKWEDKPYDELLKKYPEISSALKFWCNEHSVGDGYSVTMFNINHHKYLKDFILSNPPQFNISSSCCYYAKKKVSHELIKDTNCDLMILGIRKSEKGIRNLKYKNCYTQGENSYRPLFWFKNEDKIEYERAFNIVHSDCYTKWGFVRTGCVCCPYSKEVDYNLEAVKLYEPNMYKAVNNIFKESYEYTKQYKWYVKRMKKEKGIIRLF